MEGCFTFQWEGGGCFSNGGGASFGGAAPYAHPHYEKPYLICHVVKKTNSSLKQIPSIVPKTESFGSSSPTCYLSKKELYHRQGFPSWEDMGAVSEKKIIFLRCNII